MSEEPREGDNREGEEWAAKPGSGEWGYWKWGQSITGGRTGATTSRIKPSVTHEVAPFNARGLGVLIRSKRTWWEIPIKNKGTERCTWGSKR